MALCANGKAARLQSENNFCRFDSDQGLHIRNNRIGGTLVLMIYSIYARSFREAADLARSKSWASNQWIPFILDTEPYAVVRGAYDQSA